MDGENYINPQTAERQQQQQQKKTKISPKKKIISTGQYYIEIS